MLDIEGFFNQQSAVAASPYPVVESTTLSYNLSGASPYLISLPATVNAGDLLLIVLAIDRNPTISISDFTSISFSAYTTNLSFGVFGKVAVGNEGGTTVTITSSSSRDNGSIVYRISGWGGTLATDVVVSTFQSAASSTTPNPPALTSGFGSVATLWIAAMGFSGFADLQGIPSGYTSSGSTGTNAGTASAMICAGWKQNTAASEDPGTFALSAGVASTAATIAIKPD